MNKSFFTIGIWPSLPHMNVNEKKIVQKLTLYFMFAKLFLTSFTSSMCAEGSAIIFDMLCYFLYKGE